MKCWTCWRTALAACAVWVLGACADGYPTEDGTLVLHHGMGREAAVKAMNTIGHHGYMEHRWRYELDAGCTLRVRSRALDTGEGALPAAAPGLAARVVMAGGDGGYMVFVNSPEDAISRGGTQVLGGANQFDAGQMKWLVDYLGTLCRGVSADVK